MHISMPYWQRYMHLNRSKSFLEQTKLAKNGLLNINIYSKCVVADHVAHYTFYVSNSSPPPQSRIVRSGERCGQSQSSPLLITQPCRELFPKVLHCCIVGLGRSFILLPPHVIPIDINPKVSLYNIVTYDSEVLSRVEISFNKVWAKNNWPRQTNPLIETIIARKW